MGTPSIYVSNLFFYLVIPNGWAPYWASLQAWAAAKDHILGQMYALYYSSADINDMNMWFLEMVVTPPLVAEMWPVDRRRGLRGVSEL
jgi:hypothetical protein